MVKLRLRRASNLRRIRPSSIGGAQKTTTARRGRARLPRLFVRYYKAIRRWSGGAVDCHPTPRKPADRCDAPIAARMVLIQNVIAPWLLSKHDPFAARNSAASRRAVPA